MNIKKTCRGSIVRNADTRTENYKRIWIEKLPIESVAVRKIKYNNHHLKSVKGFSCIFQMSCLYIQTHLNLVNLDFNEHMTPHTRESAQWRPKQCISSSRFQSRCARSSYLEGFLLVWRERERERERERVLSYTKCFEIITWQQEEK